MKTVALAVLAGFLATIAPGAGAPALPCCGTACPACAPVFCKELPAISTVKAPVLAAPPAFAVFALGPIPELASAADSRFLRPTTGSAGFLRPMRN